MPKKLKVHPNERIDIPDFVRAANDYTADTVAFNILRGWLDKRSRVLEGFRVEIPDQTANPGQITVHNGNAYDRDGQLLNNEDQTNTAKSVSLSGASTTFYVEIEFIEGDSDVDARAFWDPTFDQTSPIPDGKEFQINVATRVSPDWQVVTPISTTGFDVVTNPDSTKIPLMVLTTNASNEILAGVNPGLVSVFASSVLEEDVASLATTVRVLNARHFPDVGTITVDFGAVGAEAGLSIVSVDRVNGLITFAPALASSHQAGAIVRLTSGTAQLVQQRAAGSEDLSSPTQPDVTRRMWQGDEIRGSALSTSKETFGSRDDLQVRTLKDQVDFLAAQLRELKFGAMRTDVTSQDPPESFPTVPRHFDAAGGVQGARGAAKCTIGDGVTTFGDFNGTDEVPFLAAASFVSNTGGGTVHVKEGTYTFTTTVTITDPVTIVGAGKEVTIINNGVVAGPALRFDLAAADDPNKCVMSDITVEVGAGADEAVEIETVSLVLRDCNFDGCSIELTGGTGILSRIIADSCFFNPAGSAVAAIQGTGAGFDEVLTNSTFVNCTFFDGTGARSIFGGVDLNNVACWQCAFTGARLVAQVSTNAMSDIAFYSCQGLLSSQVVAFAGAVDRFTMQSCSMTVTGGVASASLLFFGGATTNVSLENNLFATTWSGTGVGTQGRMIRFDDSAQSVAVRNCRFTVNTGQVVDMITFEGASAHDAVTIQGNEFTAFHRGIRFISTTSSTRGIAIRDNIFDGNNETFEQHGILIEDGFNLMLIDNNEFTGIDGGAVLKRGITILSPTLGFSGYITNNVISVAGSVAFGATNTACIFVDATGGTELNINIRGNLISRARSTGNVYGIFVDAGAAGVFNRVNVCDNQFAAAITSSGGVGLEAVGVRVVNVNNAIISRNSFITAGIATTGDANAACIHVSGALSTVISENEVGTPSVGGTPTLFEGGIAATGALQNLLISNNVVTERSFSTAPNGIHVVASSSIFGLRVDNNIVTFGDEMVNGILMEGTSVYEGLSCCGNTINNMNATLSANKAGIHLDLSSASAVQGVQVNNNLIVENVFDTTNTGIRIIGNGAAEAQSVQCNCNVIRGDLSGAGSRSGSVGHGIFLDECLVYQVNHNLIDWNDSGIEGHSIEVSDCNHGSINGNVCRPGSGGFFEIGHRDTSAGAIIDSNIVGSSGLGAGTIPTTGVDVLIGSDNTSTAVTNKVS